ncbi:unnamed protein product, partial [Owenia fusiformis]
HKVWIIPYVKGEHPYVTVDANDSLVYNCDVCSATFKAALTLRKHLMNNHNFERPLKCMYCEKRSLNFKKLSNHVLRQHKPCQMKCEICSKVFSLQCNLEAHIVNIHKGGNIAQKIPQICPTCGKVYQSKKSLASHVLMVHEDGKVRFKQNQAAKPPGVCLTCGKMFSTLKSLRIHEKNHSTIRPHVCQQCGVSYAVKDQLNRHMSSHEKPFECDTCGAKFSRRYNLKQHEKVHSGVKEYECKICGRQFTQLAALCGHSKTCGKEELEVKTTNYGSDYIAYN